MRARARAIIISRVESDRRIEYITQNRIVQMIIVSEVQHAFSALQRIINYVYVYGAGNVAQLFKRNISRDINYIVEYKNKLLLRF